MFCGVGKQANENHHAKQQGVLVVSPQSGSARSKRGRVNIKPATKKKKNILPLRLGVIVRSTKKVYMITLL